MPRDTNGVLDAYEWEMEGTGTCGIGQGSRGGCIYLLSQGSATNSSYVIGESKNGSDVFIATKALLTPEAGDELFKLYDARVDRSGTGFTSGVYWYWLSGRTSGRRPSLRTPASVTYAGVGNFSAPTEPVVGKIKAKSLTSAQRRLAKALESCKRGNRVSEECFVKRALGSYMELGLRLRDVHAQRLGGSSHGQAIHRGGCLLLVF